MSAPEEALATMLPIWASQNGLLVWGSMTWTSTMTTTASVLLCWYLFSGFFSPSLRCDFHQRWLQQAVLFPEGIWADRCGLAVLRLRRTMGAGLDKSLKPRGNYREHDQQPHMAHLLLCCLPSGWNNSSEPP